MTAILPVSILAFIFGACIGSFLNVCIYRIPAGVSIVHPGSSCPRCKSMIPFYDTLRHAIPEDLPLDIMPAEVAPTVENARPASGQSPPGMVWIPGGEFLMGSDSHYRDEGPVRQVSVEGFWIDSQPVTNTEFARFVAETGHITLADITGVWAVAQQPLELLLRGARRAQLAPLRLDPA